jgi:hypothetical protein
MKTIELIAEMQKNLTALKEQQVNEVSELEAYKAKQREKVKQLETSILSALAAFLHEDEVTAPASVESPVEDAETTSAEAEAALEQAKSLAEKEAAEKKRKADIAEAKALAAKAKAEQEANGRKELSAAAEKALKEAADRKAAEDAAKEAAAKEAAAKEAAAKEAAAKEAAAKEAAAKEAAAKEAAAKEAAAKEAAEPTGDDSKLEKLLDKYQHPITLRAIENLKANGHEAMLKPSRNKMGWFCRSVEANKLILDETERIIAEEQKALFADGSGAEQHLKEIGAFAMARKKASTFGRQSAIMDKFPVTLDGIDKSQHMEKLGTAARMCMLGKLFSSDQFKEYLEPYGLTSMAQLPIDKVNEFYQHMLTSCMYNVDKEQD